MKVLARACAALVLPLSGCTVALPNASRPIVVEAPECAPARPCSRVVPQVGPPDAPVYDAVVVRRRPIEWDVGVDLGVATSGNQDLSFKRYDSLGVATDDLWTADVHESRGALVGVHIAGWDECGWLRDMGLRFDAARWSTRARAGSFVDRIAPPHSSATPPFDSVLEDRTSLLLSIARRFALRGGSPATMEEPYAYVGAGGGAAYSSVTHGGSDWGMTIQAFGGVSIPVRERVALHLEGRYIQTGEVHARRTEDWGVDTSGTHVAHLPAHFDTRFFALVLGVEFSL